MPWRKEDIVSLREEFVIMSLSGMVSFKELCGRYGISRQAGYKWVERYKQAGRAGLRDKSHRPLISPHQTPTEIEQQIIAWRQRVPEWGARKIHRLLKDKVSQLPSARTITHILKRHGLISAEASQKRQAWQRFERAAPNELWQMDFKGYIPTTAGISYPLTILDDHSRFNICLQALENERTAGVKSSLTAAFRRYGLPEAILSDNGSPWGGKGSAELTELGVWLMRIGIKINHSRPYHPQTLGKDERFHQTLNQELLKKENWQSRAQMQQAFDPWRERYNHERPHEALSMEVPASRYQPSPRIFPEMLPEPEYAKDVQVRSVDVGGDISFNNRRIKVSKAFRRQRVGIKASAVDGCYDVFYFEHKIKQFNLHSKEDCQ